jgi:hypothetical protein
VLVLKMRIVADADERRDGFHRLPSRDSGCPKWALVHGRRGL